MVYFYNSSLPTSRLYFCSFCRCWNFNILHTWENPFNSLLRNIFLKLKSTSLLTKISQVHPVYSLSPTLPALLPKDSLEGDQRLSCPLVQIGSANGEPRQEVHEGEWTQGIYSPCLLRQGHLEWARSSTTSLVDLLLICSQSPQTALGSHIVSYGLLTPSIHFPKLLLP